MGCSNNKSVQIDPENQKNELKSDENKKSLDKENSANFLLTSYNKGSAYNQTEFKDKKRLKSPKNGKDAAFTIKTLRTNDCEIDIINIKVSLFLRVFLIPIWVEKGNYIKFKIQGKWRINKNFEYSDSIGISTPKNNNFNYGALVGRVGRGKEFVLKPGEFIHYSDTEGPIYLRMNFPKNVKVNPQGEMEVKIFDGTLLTMDQINEKIGWKAKELRYVFDDATELENNLTNDINNLRMNPILFYEKNIKNGRNAVWTEDFLNKMEYQNSINGIKPLSANNTCYYELHNYMALNYEYIYEKLDNRNLNKFVEELQEQINVNVDSRFSCDNLVNCRITKKESSLDICNQFLLDKKIRRSIFNEKFKSIAVNVFDNFYDDAYFIILVILEVGGDEEKYEKYMNEQSDNIDKNKNSKQNNEDIANI